MRTDDFDRHIMEELSQIPPAELPRFTPWRPAMDRIVVGTALLTFRFQFFYLQYLLPLLGAVLVYLGYRSLRLENRWFRLGWLLSALLLASHMALDVLAATPVMAMLAASPAVDGTLTWLLQGASLLMLLALWRGTRAVFLSSGTENLPRDWLGQGLLCHLLALAVALWDQLVPASQPGLLGLSITNEWLYYGRPIFMILLELRFLICIYRQSETLSGFGDHISPVPVRLSSRTVLAGSFAAVLLSLPIALWVSGHIPTSGKPAALLTPEQAAVQAQLVSLGLPEDIAAALDAAELERCADASAVSGVFWYDPEGPGTETDTPFPAQALTDGIAELSSWLIFLPEGQVRQIHWFRYSVLPRLRLQEQFSVSPSGQYPTTDYAGRLLWHEEGQLWCASPRVRLAGGETAEYVEEHPYVYPLIDTTRMELERLGGHLRYYPWIAFSIPAQAENLRGYLAYTVDASQMPQPSDIHFSSPEQWSYTDTWSVFLRHQTHWLHYPFASISSYGGSSYTGRSGPIQTIHAVFSFHF